jgi:hypothetical protein
MPLAILLTFVVFLVFGAVLLLPIYGAVLLWLGDYLGASLSFLGALGVYFIARRLAKLMS